MQVDVSHGDGVMTLTLNRPDVLNAFDEGMHLALAEALEQARAEDVRAVVVTGAGRGFCVGQDVSQFPRQPAAVGDLLRRRFNPNIRALRALEKPVIAAVNGPAAGAGLALALACDIRLAATTGSFIPAFVGIGLVPDSGTTHALSRLIGPARAFEWIVSGRRLTAEEALSLGLVTQVVAADQLVESARELAGGLAAMPTRAIALTKRLFEDAPLATLEEQLEAEARLQEVAAATRDFDEGVRAFLEKRAPRFEGR